jgi:hypothetical protein
MSLDRCVFLIICLAPTAIKTTYSSSLTEMSPSFTRYLGTSTGYYYILLKLNVPKSGMYNIRTDSHMDLFVYIYHTQFSSSNPQSNLIAYSNQCGGRKQFQSMITLDNERDFYIVISTSFPDMTGLFAVIVESGTQVNMTEVQRKTSC